jgi:hypothetical protein
MHTYVKNWILQLIREATKKGLHMRGVVDTYPIDLPENYSTEAASVIFQDILPQWSEEFLEKNSRYGETANLLGAKGQFADLWRKIGPLKRILWDGKDLPGESAEEVLRDLIGHCFLTLYFINKEK